MLCPEGAATYAAYKESLADGRVTKSDRVMLFNCATGLKYPLPPVTRTLDRHQPIDYAKIVVRAIETEYREDAMRRAVVAALMALLTWSGSALADDFPSHPITIVVPFSAGGPTDAMARILGERMQRTLGQPIMIENVTGAAGSLGVGRVVRVAA